MLEHAPLLNKFRNVCADVVQSAEKDKIHWAQKKKKKNNT